MNAESPHSDDLILAILRAFLAIVSARHKMAILLAFNHFLGPKTDTSIVSSRHDNVHGVPLVGLAEAHAQDLITR